MSAVLSVGVAALTLLAAGPSAGPGRTPPAGAATDRPAALFKIVPPIASPPFQLMDLAGKPVRLADFSGQVVLLTFFYTSCPDTCPLFTARLRSLEQRLGLLFGTEVAFLLVTLDPARDTAEVLREYAKRFDGVRPGWWFLRGTALEIERVARSYGVFSSHSHGGATLDHASVMYLLGRAGVQRVKYVGRDLDVAVVEKHVRAVLGADGGASQGTSGRTKP